MTVRFTAPGEAHVEGSRTQGVPPVQPVQTRGEGGRMTTGMPHHAKVFCVNWGHDAPATRHVVAVFDRRGRIVTGTNFATLTEAIAYVDKLREAFAPVTRADFTRRA